MPEKSKDKRLRFDEEIMKQCAEFSDKLLEEHPELTTVAIVPIWSISGVADQLPMGTWRGNEGQTLTLDDINDAVAQLNKLTYHLASIMLASISKQLDAFKQSAADAEKKKEPTATK